MKNRDACSEDIYKPVIEKRHVLAEVRSRHYFQALCLWAKQSLSLFKFGCSCTPFESEPLEEPDQIW